MIEVRRAEDGELCGHVRATDDGGWESLTVFGGRLGVHERRHDAEDHVRLLGLACLAERWSYEDEAVCILEANPEEVTIALGYYALPGVPTRRLTAAEAAAGLSRQR